MAVVCVSVAAAEMTTTTTTTKVMRLMRYVGSHVACCMLHVACCVRMHTAYCILHTACIQTRQDKTSHMLLLLLLLFLFGSFLFFCRSRDFFLGTFRGRGSNGL